MGVAKQEWATLKAKVAHSKAFFALVSTNDGYPAERREFAKKIAQYISDETKRVSGNRIFKMRTDQKAYGDSRLEYGRAADELLDRSEGTKLEKLVAMHSKENLELGAYVRSSYDKLISAFTELLEMEAVSGVADERLDAGYLQTAYHHLDGAAHAFIGSAQRAWADDAEDRRALYAEMDADFPGKVNDYRNAIGEKTRRLDVLRATSDGLCKKGMKVTASEFKALVERKNPELTPKGGGKEGYA